MRDAGDLLMEHGIQPRTLLLMLAEIQLVHMQLVLHVVHVELVLHVVHVQFVLHVGPLGLTLVLTGATLPLELLEVEGDPLQVERDIGVPLLVSRQLVVAVHLAHEIRSQGLAFLEALHVLHADLQVAHHLVL